MCQLSSKLVCVGWVPDSEPASKTSRLDVLPAEGRGFEVGLVVEDDGDLAGVLTASFDRHGIQTFHAADGAQAILISQRELPDLLVLDLGLPEVDGFAVVEWLRRHERLHAMPMVVYTARDLDDGDRRRLQLGSTTQFLTKGRITSSDLEQRVMGLLGRLTPATRLWRERCCASLPAPEQSSPGAWCRSAEPCRASRQGPDAPQSRVSGRLVGDVGA